LIDKDFFYDEISIGTGAVMCQQKIRHTMRAGIARTAISKAGDVCGVLSSPAGSAVLTCRKSIRWKR
jgi:hypothetical protein